MKNLSPNAPCPCGSGQKYKKCCRLYHLGKTAPDALTLMKSRYSAYAAGEADYIIRTTHPEHPEYRRQTKEWKKEILDFCHFTEFHRLEILSRRQNGSEGWVHFIAHLSTGPMEECSRFLREEQWLYHSALPVPCPSDSGDSREFE